MKSIEAEYGLSASKAFEHYCDTGCLSKLDDASGAFDAAMRCNTESDFIIMLTIITHSDLQGDHDKWASFVSKCLDSPFESVRASSVGLLRRLSGFMDKKVLETLLDKASRSNCSQTRTNVIALFGKQALID
jgi:hypothetical protein